MLAREAAALLGLPSSPQYTALASILASAVPRTSPTRVSTRKRRGGTEQCAGEGEGLAVQPVAVRYESDRWLAGASRCRPKTPCRADGRQKAEGCDCGAGRALQRHEWSRGALPVTITSL